MNNKIIIGIVLVIVVIGGMYYFTKQQYQPSQQLPEVQQPTTKQPQVAADKNTITIQNFTFNPATLTVKQGTKVTWINQDSTTHKIKADTFNSVDLNQGDKFEFTFDKQGTFDYICIIHPSMSGKIVVE